MNEAGDRFVEVLLASTPGADKLHHSGFLHLPTVIGDVLGAGVLKHLRHFAWACDPFGEHDEDPAPKRMAQGIEYRGIPTSRMSASFS